MRRQNERYSHLGMVSNWAELMETNSQYKYALWYHRLMVCSSSTLSELIGEGVGGRLSKESKGRGRPAVIFDA